MKRLLILDMNKLLIFRAFEPDMAKENPEAFAMRELGTLVYKTRVWKRPGLGDFLAFCFANFTVAVWSSAQYHNLEAILKYTFSFAQIRLLRFVWCQNECTVVDPHPDPEEENKPLYKKQLKKVWSVFEGYDSTNTLILDDSPMKLEDNPVECCIHISSWVPYEGDGMGDTVFEETGILRKKLLEKINPNPEIPK